MPQNAGYQLSVRPLGFTLYYGCHGYYILFAFTRCFYLGAYRCNLFLVISLHHIDAFRAVIGCKKEISIRKKIPLPAASLGRKLFLIKMREFCGNMILNVGDG